MVRTALTPLDANDPEALWESFYEVAVLAFGQVGALPCC